MSQERAYNKMSGRLRRASLRVGLKLRAPESIEVYTAKTFQAEGTARTKALWREEAQRAKTRPWPKWESLGGFKAKGSCLFLPWEQHGRHDYAHFTVEHTGALGHHETTWQKFMMDEQSLGELDHACLPSRKPDRDHHASPLKFLLAHLYPPNIPVLWVFLFLLSAEKNGK